MNPQLTRARIKEMDDATLREVEASVRRALPQAERELWRMKRGLVWMKRELKARKPKA